MSYRTRKLKRSLLSRLKFKSRLGWNQFFYNLKKRWIGGDMRFPATRKVMEFLRKRTQLIRKNNLKISEWVDEYLDRCVSQGEAVTILTQWCISKNLELRRERQGMKFVPTKKERAIFSIDLPQIVEVLRANGIRFSWWFTFNRSYLDSRRPDRSLEAEYKEMIRELAAPLVDEGWLIFADWEDDILGRRPEPNAEVLQEIDRYVTPEALAFEMQWNSAWAVEEANLRQSEDELRRDVCFQIACEAEEGRLLGGANSPFGEFILMPLEVPEQYDFFAIFVKDFKKRIVAALPPYPWRLKENA